MIRTRTEALIMCLDCAKTYGTVQAHEDTNRPGFWSHTCEPEPMPLKCDHCNEFLTRVLQS